MMTIRPYQKAKNISLYTTITQNMKGALLNNMATLVLCTTITQNMKGALFHNMATSEGKSLHTYHLQFTPTDRNNPFGFQYR